MTFTTSSRIGSASGDVVIALFVYLVVLAALMMIWARDQPPIERTMRLLIVYLAYGTFEVLVKRATHYAWYVYPIRFGLFFLLMGYWFATRASFMDKRARVPLLLPLGAYLALAGLQVFNPYLPSPIVGVFGWLSDFIFVFLYFVAFDLLRSERLVRRLMWATAALGTLSAIACGLEQWFGPDQFMASYPSFVPLGIFLEDGSVHYRPASLSPYMEIFGIAAMVTLIAAKEKRSLWLTIGIACCVLANIFHAVRITWITGLVFIGLFLLLERRRSVMTTAFVAVTIGIAIQIALSFNDLLGGQLASTKTPIETLQSTRLSGLTALPNVVARYPLGFGVGESSPGLRFVDASEVLRFGGHNYFTELAVQLSLLGPLLLLIFSIGILAIGYRARRKVRDQRWHADLSGSMALMAALLLSFLVGGALGAFPVSEYFWLLAGAIARMSMPQKARVPVTPRVVKARAPWAAAYRLSAAGPRRRA